MTIEYLKCKADLNLEVNFGLNGAIGTVSILLDADWCKSLTEVSEYFYTFGTCAL